MAVLQIAADRTGAGKTSLAGALILHLAAAGKQGVYYKPFSPAGKEDQDVAFFSQQPLAGVNPPEALGARLLPTDAGSGATLEASLAGDLKSQLTGLKGRADSVLLESPDLASSSGAASSLALQLSLTLDSRVVLVFGYNKSMSADAISQACHPFGERLAGVIINGVTKYRTAQVNTELAPTLRSQGVPFLGAVAEDRAMLGVSVQQIADYLGGRWVQEPENTGAPVQQFLIGGNIMDAGPTYFGRHSNQAVVTRAARPDIQMASLTSDILCLVLTGGEEPAEYVKAEALQRGVPMILVDASTLDTAEALGGLLGIASARSRQKIERFLHLLQQSVDLEALASAANA